jgi:hypothetical protein
MLASCLLSQQAAEPEDSSSPSTWPCMRVQLLHRLNRAHHWLQEAGQLKPPGMRVIPGCTDESAAA